MNRIALCVFIFALTCDVFADRACAAQLPQRYPYQKVLRDYLATLTEADFTVELKPLVFDEAFFKDPANVERYWMLFITPGTEAPDGSGILIAPKYFTLAAIEAGDKVNLGTGPKGAFLDPKNTVWWTQWDYPGNPYKGSKPLQLRSIAVAAADMMMQLEEHESGANLRSDYLGGSIIRWAYTYYVAKDVMPEAARKAYAAGLTKAFEWLEQLTPTGSGGSDMEFFQLVGMWYAADALGGDFPKRALARAHRVIDTITSKTGNEKHGGAFDASYQGIALRFLTWAAMLYNDPKIDQALHKMLVLKAYLSFPEPAKPAPALYGPTHFNTGTAAGAPNDQWAWVSRDFAMGMIDDLALYTIWARVGVPSEDVMRLAIKNGIARIATDKPSEVVPGPWVHVHWGMTLPFAFDHYKKGFYQRLVELAKTGSPLTKPIYSREKNFIRDLNGGGEFLAAKFDDYAVVLHTGAIASHWANGVSGKSGGSISAFWTPEAGSVILGRARATQSGTPDEWDDKNQRGPYTWLVNAITGKGSNGGYFSTARIQGITSKFEIHGDTIAVVTVSGDLAGATLADMNDELKGKVQYAREFRIDKSGLAVTSSLTTDGTDKITELWEMIPIFNGPKEAAMKTELRVNGQWVEATETPAEADRARVTRYGKAVSIALEKPLPMKIMPLNKPEETWHVTGRNLMIDLVGLLPNPRVKYRVTATP